MEVDKGSDQSQTSSPTGCLRMPVWRMNLRRTKSVIISWIGSFYACFTYHTLNVLDTLWKISWVRYTNHMGFHDGTYYIIRIFHGCEVQKEKSVQGSLFGITRLCWVMPNSDPEGRIFLSASNNHDRFFFLHTFWSPAFDFNVGVAINESLPICWFCHIEIWRRMWRHIDVKSQLLNNVTWPPIQPMYWQHDCVVIRFLSVPWVG